MNYYTINKNCRFCKSNNLIKVIEIGNSPISEKYSLNQFDLPEDIVVPLDVYMCNDCKLVQLIHVVNPSYLWDNFTFKTSRNKKLNNHYENYANDVIEFTNLKKKKFHIDIGSNDGTLLEIFKNKGFINILGVDPAKQIAEEANKKGLKTITDFFGLKLSKVIKENYGCANIITANNVFAHIDSIEDVLNGVKNLLDKDGLFVFEVSYLLDIIQKKLIGTIFHEHLCYYSVYTLEKYLKSHGLQIVNVLRNKLQGGSIVCYVQFFGGPYKVSQNVYNLVNLELSSNLNIIETIKEYNNELKNIKYQINKKLQIYLKENKIICGYGSSRSATTLIYYFELQKYISFIIDDNEDKHYKYTPGSRIEVFPKEKIKKNKPDYMIILAWEHNDNIILNNQSYIDSGGKFIKIFPDFKIV